MDRITYRSSMGDYGLQKFFNDERSEIYALRNALGAYEDLGYTADELKAMLQNLDEPKSEVANENQERLCNEQQFE